MGKVTPGKGIDFSTTARWYVVANRTDAVFYVEGQDHQFHFIDRLTNKKGNYTESELDSDRPGRGYSSAAGGTIHHSMDRRNQKHETVAKDFADRIAHALGSARRENRFKDVVLVAEPHFLGLLREHLDAETRAKIAHEVHREYLEGSDSEIRERILDAIKTGK